MKEIGKILILLGAISIFLGMALSSNWLPLGRLPGDFVWRRGNVTVFLPLGTMLLISILLTIIMAFFSRR